MSLLRSRAASLAKNSPVGAAAINSQVTGVIGAGLKLFPRIKADVLGLSSAEAREWSRKTKREFELWSSAATSCDYMRRNNFPELQRIAFQSFLIDGDCFCLFRRRVPTRFEPYSLRLQLVEAMRVSNPLQADTFLSNGVEMRRGNNRIINGIEVDADGAQVAIWISNRVWNEPSLTGELSWRRVRWYGLRTGVRNVLHISCDTRPDQFRGVPFLAPVVESLKQISRYADAELTSAIIKSFFSIFFTQPLTNNDLNGILQGKEPEEVDVGDYKLGAGTMAALPRGVDVKAIDSSNAQSTFDMFTSAFLKQIGAALNIPYEVLMKSFTASYSASRAALLQAADEFRIRKKNFINDFCAPIYEQWLTEAVVSGRINAPGYFDDPIKRLAWSSADWFNEQTRFLDPVKELEGIKRQIELGLTTREASAAELLGVDFWDNLPLLEQENAALTEVFT